VNKIFLNVNIILNANVILDPHCVRERSGAGIASFFLFV